MKIRIGPPGLQVEDEIPSPIEVLDAFGSPNELPGKKVKRLGDLFKSYGEKKTEVKMSGKLEVDLK